MHGETIKISRRRFSTISLTLLVQKDCVLKHEVTVTNFKEISHEDVAWIYKALLITVAQKNLAIPVFLVEKSLLKNDSLP